ncbi:MAG: PfaD family polyunsaturated fatty acid/polyketide biosynthesis protein [bacterium]|nr:PfaD family polyunsaturated fatty acid/polyketide biosynthesis protein [bacterium]
MQNFAKYLQNFKKTYYLTKELFLKEKLASDTIGIVPTILPEDLGSTDFKQAYCLKYAYMGGSMANEISSAEMVISMGKAGILCSYGAGGVSPKIIEKAIIDIQKELPNGPYCFNLIHSPYETAAEMNAVKLYLKYNIDIIEASAYINLTPSLVYYRASGLSRDKNGNIIIKNKVIAKVSRTKIAQRFMEPPSKKFVKKLLEEGLITQEQADLVMQVPIADSITIEADSGGHTDNRPLISIYTVIKNLRDQLHEKYNLKDKIHIGVAGGISTPHSALAAFSMGADYVVTGSINQSCIEAGTSEHVKNLLQSVLVSDVAMAPAADMFEMGVRVQVLKKGSLYAVRAQKLYDLYIRYDSINDIPKNEKLKVEKQFFGKTMEAVWQETVAFFKERDPAKLEKVGDSEKQKMALIFRWYLGLSPLWARKADKEHKSDYQIWCGPSMGAFNDWVKNTDLALAENRKVVDIAERLMVGVAVLYRENILKCFFK